MTGCHSQHPGLLNICPACHMGSTSLHQIQLNGTHFTSDPAADHFLQYTGTSGNITVTKGINSTALYAFRDVNTIFIFDSFTDCYKHTVVSLQFTLYILQKTFYRKCRFTKINKIGTFSPIISGKCRSCCQPSCISSHYLHDGHGFGVIYMTVAFQFCKRNSNIFGSRTESRTVIGTYQVIIDRFRSPDHMDVVHSFFSAVSRQLVHRIHRIIAAGVNKVFDIMFAENLHYSGKLTVIHCRIFQFKSTGSQCCCRCLTQQIQVTGSLDFFPKIHKTLF